MTYRDDHDAAVARVDALEQELAEAKRARAALDDAPTQPPPRPAPAPPGVDGLLVGLGVVVVVGATLIGGEAGMRRLGDATEPSSRAQRVLSAPADAASRVIDAGLARMRAELPGGHLTRITIVGVDERGILRDDLGGLELRFAGDRTDCLVMTWKAAAWAELEGDRCKESDVPPPQRPIVPPRCTASAVWQLATLDGAHRGEIAKLVYDGAWTFTIAELESRFSATYTDNCTR